MKKTLFLILTVILMMSLNLSPFPRVAVAQPNPNEDGGVPTDANPVSKKQVRVEARDNWNKAKNEYKKTRESYYSAAYESQFADEEYDAANATLTSLENQRKAINAALNEESIKQKFPIPEGALPTYRQQMTQKREAESKRLKEQLKELQGDDGKGGQIAEQYKIINGENGAGGLKKAKDDAQATFDSEKSKNPKESLDTAAKQSAITAQDGSNWGWFQGHNKLKKQTGKNKDKVIGDLNKEAMTAAQEKFQAKHPKLETLPSISKKTAPPPAPVTVVTDYQKRCDTWKGEYTANTKTCKVGDITLGQYVLDQVGDYDVAKIEDLKKNPILEKFLTQTGTQAECGTNEKSIATCKALESFYLDQAPYCYKDKQVVISAKEFCQGPYSTDGKASTLAQLLGLKDKEAPKPVEPTAEECSKAYAEVAKLVLAKPENKTFLSNMIQVAALKMSRLNTRSNKKTVEGFAKTQLKGESEFASKLKNTYFDYSGDVEKIKEKLKSANYFDRSVTSKGVKNTKTRFDNKDSSALILYLSTQKDSEFSASDSAAVWAQNEIFKNLDLRYGKSAGNQMNFSTLVYHYNTKMLESGYKEGDMSQKNETMIQDALKTQLQTSSELTTALQNSRCLKNKDGSFCSDQNSVLDASGLEQIKGKVAELAAGKVLEGFKGKTEFSMSSLKQTKGTDGKFDGFEIEFQK
jgi:hypothetical protein